MRTSRRLSMKDEPVVEAMETDGDSDADFWGPEDGVPAPTDDPAWTKEDQAWRKSAVNKYVYFRWSTAFNSKNRFKGIVTEHVSRMGQKNSRLDFLTIRTLGISEDRYRMGKDIRELLVLPNKTSLMETIDEEELKERAIRKWSTRDGWTDATESMTSASTQASTPVTAKHQEPIKEFQVKKKVVRLPQAIKKVEVRTVQKKPGDLENSDGVIVTAVHSKSSIAGKLLAGKFSFYN